MLSFFEMIVLDKIKGVQECRMPGTLVVCLYWFLFFVFCIGDDKKLHVL